MPRSSALALPLIALALLLSGCPQSSNLDGGSEEDIGSSPDTPVTPHDAPPPLDEGVPVDAPEMIDAAVPDAPAPEPCTMPGAIETLTCGMCGTRDRFCTVAGVWEYSLCANETGACAAGTTREVSCGRCGTARERCTASCTWAPGACTGETGMCTPGEVEFSAMGCAAGEVHRRTCDAMCAWGAFDTCVGSPDDVDGDGAGSVVDCDDTDPGIFPGSTQDCGSFICEDPMGLPTFARGTRTCLGPHFGACTRPRACPEASDSVCRALGGMGFESRPCPRGRWDCFDTEQTRRCTGPFGAEVWSPWTPDSCPPPLTTPPPRCMGTTACGLCGEGVAFTACNIDCVPTPSECVGRGCTPGVLTRSTTGCAPGRYLESVCSASCVSGTTDDCACTPGFTMCGAECADLMTNRRHCMACDNSCGPTEACIAGACVPAPLYHGWTSPIPGCSTTSWDTTAPTVLGGTYPYNTTDSLACRAWKLAATVCTTEPTMYAGTPDNWECPVSGGFTDPVFGTYCMAPGTQYACSTCPGACNAACAFRPLSLRNCMGMESNQL